MQWRKGRGTLGIFEPLLGAWIAQAQSPMGPVSVSREFRKTLGGKYVEMQVAWQLKNSQYEELALFGVGEHKKLCFWSFTSDGKRSNGEIATATTIHPAALAFQAQMPAGLARQVYWPDTEAGFHWVVESHTQKGWNRFVEHHYLAK